MQRLFARAAMLAVIHRIAFGVCCGQVAVSPNTVTVLFGRTVVGDVTSLFVPGDGQVLRMTFFSVPNVTVDPVNFRVEGKLPFKPVSMTFTVNSRSVHGGIYRQS